jgi:uncharacterized protein (DUF2147 family)
MKFSIQYINKTMKINNLKHAITAYLIHSSVTKVILLSSLFVLSLGIIPINAQAEIEGKWRDNDKGVMVLIYEEEGKYFGQLIESDNAEANEKIQSNGKIIILRDFKKESETKFCCGKIYQPKKKKSFSASIELEDENTLKIIVKKGIIKRTQSWTKI